MLLAIHMLIIEWQKMAKSTIFNKIFDEICIFDERKIAFLAAKCFGAYVSLINLDATVSKSTEDRWLYKIVTREHITKWKVCMWWHISKIADTWCISTAFNIWHENTAWRGRNCSRTGVILNCIIKQVAQLWQRYHTTHTVLWFAKLWELRIGYSYGGLWG